MGIYGEDNFINELTQIKVNAEPTDEEMEQLYNALGIKPREQQTKAKRSIYKPPYNEERAKEISYRVVNKDENLKEYRNQLGKYKK